MVLIGVLVPAAETMKKCSMKTKWSETAEQRKMEKATFNGFCLEVLKGKAFSKNSLTEVSFFSRSFDFSFLWCSRLRIIFIAYINHPSVLEGRRQQTTWNGLRILQFGNGKFCETNWFLAHKKIGNPDSPVCHWNDKMLRAFFYWSLFVLLKCILLCGEFRRKRQFMRRDIEN